MKRISVILICLFIFAQATLAKDRSPQTKPTKTPSLITLNVEKYQLKNGLTVLLQPDRSVPVVSYQTWFKVGSKDEEKGYTGIAHLFEHMMFKGAKRYTNSDFDKVLRATGASYNAFTSQDYTGYYIDISSDKLETAIDLESDRLEFLQLNNDHLKSEREVVKEERRYRYDNSIMGTLHLHTFENFFDKGVSYHWPVIGYMDDLTAIDLEKCKAFFKQFYSTNNATVVVAGDFDIATVKKLIEKYYGHMKPSEIHRLTQQKQTPITQARVKTIEKETQAEVFSLTYGVPPQGSDESFAFDLLSSVLSEGTSSRLYRKIIRELALADSASATNYSLLNSGLFMFTVSMKNTAQPADREKVLEAIEGELWRVKNQNISAQELEKAKTYVMKSYIDGLKTINGKARLIGMYETYFNDYTRIFSDLEKYNDVTVDQIKKLANKYLNKAQSSLVVITKAKPSTKTALNATQDQKE